MGRSTARNAEACRFRCRATDLDRPIHFLRGPEDCRRLDPPEKLSVLFLEICELRSVIGNEHGEQACWFGRAGVLADEM